MNIASETSEVREGQGLNESRLADYLHANIPGFELPMSIRQFRGGQSNPTFLIETPKHHYVLRKKPPGVLLPSAHQIEREYRVIRALASTDVPVPAGLLLCEDAEIIGTPFYVMDCVEGRVLRDPRLPELNPARRTAIYEAMAATLATLHQVDWSAVGLVDYGKPADYVRRQVQRWSRQYEASKTHDIPAMDQLIKWLQDNLPPQGDTSIAHGDYRIENLVFHPHEDKVIAVLDWELATLGDPLSDLAYNCMAYHLPSSMRALGGIADVNLASLGIPNEKNYVAAYCRHTKQDSIPHWTYYKAFAMFRCAAILQGVYSRAQNSNATGSDALEVGKLAGPVAEIAWRLVS